MRQPNRGDYRYFSAVATVQRLKALQKKLEKFESGKMYREMQEKLDKAERRHDAEIRKLKKKHALEIAELEKTIKGLRKIIAELQDDWDADRESGRRVIDRLQAEIAQLEQKVAELRGNVRSAAKEKYEAQTEATELRGKLDDLVRRINQNETNSSRPTSDGKFDAKKVYERKKRREQIPNSREKTGRSPGGQPGHIGKTAKFLKPTHVVWLPDPEHENNSEYARSKEYTARQVVHVKLDVEVIEYRAVIYRKRDNGSRVHATFPADVPNRITYGPSLRAWVLYLTYYCNMPEEKVAGFIRSVNDQHFAPSIGFIAGLAKEFSDLTEGAREEIFRRLRDARYLHIDNTPATMNGDLVPVTVTASATEAYYIASEHKGIEAANKTPVYKYKGCVIHDREATYLRDDYGTMDQICVVHLLRNLIEARENEPNKKWARRMHKFLTFLVRAHNEKIPFPLLEKSAFVHKVYMQILKQAEREYEYEPAESFTKGYALMKALQKLENEVLCFVDHPWVPHDNNRAERLLRKIKVKNRSAVTFRCFESVEHYCHFLTYSQTALSQDRDLFKSIEEVFATRYPYTELHTSAESAA